MAAQVIHYRFRLRRAAAARWTTTNDLLYQGEIGVETDTNFMKLGDGVTQWNNLPYWNGAPISGFNNIADGQVLAWDATNSQWVPADAGKQYQAGSGINIANASTATPTINSTLGSIALSGRVSAYSNLPTGLTSSDAGTAYLNDGDGLIYVWDGSAWPSAGSGIASSGLQDYSGNPNYIAPGINRIPKHASRFLDITIGGQQYVVPAFYIEQDPVIAYFNQTGALGIYCDLLDLTRLFQDAARTTPVTATGQPVGYIYDKSGNGYDGKQPTASQRPTYHIDSNGNPYLHCDASKKQHLQFPQFISGADPRTFVTANYLPSFGGAQSNSLVSLQDGSSPSAGGAWAPGLESDYVWLRVYGYARWSYPNGTPPTSNFVLSMRWSTSRNQYPGSTSTRLNATALAWQAAQNNTINTANTGTTLIGQSNAESDNVTGNYYGFVLFKDDISDAQVHSFETELGKKAGLTV